MQQLRALDRAARRHHAARALELLNVQSAAAGIAWGEGKAAKKLSGELVKEATGRDANG